ncbi:MAG: MFS transporter [Planctomycetota bacterium]|nr:MAG: MFS transporter [Planctomycetota bacterium]
MSENASTGLNHQTREQQLLFWGCFIALVTTAFGFIARMFLISTWQKEFGLDPAESGRLAGIGIWPFAVSIIGFSLFIDRIGYKTAMVLAFLGHMTWAVMGVGAYLLSQQGQTDTAYSLLYWGSLVLGLANGTVEAFINPVVATMFSREKTKWLNILHAGWPGGLVVAGVLTIFLDFLPWGAKVGMLAVPALIYFFMLIPLKFPIQEREAAGVSYREMLAEFGVLGAAVVGFLVTLQLMDFFQGVEAVSTKTPDGTLVLAGWAKAMFIAIGVAIVLAFGIYTRSLGRPLMFFLILIMMPLATTEIGTDGWITTIMEGVAEGKFHPGWILVYTSAIMMVLRFFAGPIVHALSPLGLLAVSSLLAIVGLLSLSNAVGAMIFVAATLYGFGKTFFWPTMLGVVSEQTPKGGALTLNAISGIGMLAVGTLGFPYIGALQAEQQIRALEESEVARRIPGLIVDGKLQAVTDKVIYEIISYTIVDQEKLREIVQQAARKDPQLNAEKVLAELDAVIQRSNQAALGRMAMFPGIMLAGYLILILYFRAQGGYRAQVLVGHEAEDEKFVGGVEGAVEA